MSTVQDRWEGSYEDDVTGKRPSDEHLQLMLLFVQEHEATLKSVLEKTRNTICQVSDKHFIPIQIGLESLERVYPQDLLNTTELSIQERPQHENFHKILLVFIYLQDEIHELKSIAETKFFYPLLMFGQLPSYSVKERPDGSLDLSSKASEPIVLQPGEKESMIGSFLPFLQELSNFVDRCYSVALNLIQQLGAFMQPSRELIFKRIFQTSKMNSTFNALGELLYVLVILDLIIQQNDQLLEYWSHYKSMVTIMRSNPASFETSDERIMKLERLVVSIDQTLMIGEIFKGAIEQDFDDTSALGNSSTLKESVRSNTILLSDMLSFIKSTLDNSMTAIHSFTDVHEKSGVIMSMALYVLYRQLLPANQPPDAKLHKVLWNIQKTLPFIVLYDKVIWTVPEFLSNFLIFDLKKLEISNPIAHRRAFMATYDKELASKTAHLVAQCNAWYIICESKIQASLRYEVSNLLGTLDVYGSILLKGLSLASRARYLANTTLMMHTSMQIPLTKSNCNDIALLVEHLKAIEYTFVRKDFTLSEVLPHIIRQLADEIVKQFKPIKIKLESLKMSARASSPDNYGRASFCLYIILLLENLLKTTDNYTSLRQTVLTFLHELASLSTVMGSEKDLQKLKVYIQRITQLSTLQYYIRSISETKFLYYHLDLLTPLIQAIYTSTTEGNRLQYLLAAFCDGAKLIQQCRHLNYASAAPTVHISDFISSYRVAIKAILLKELVLPLCHDIETDLRLHVHMKHLPHMQTYNPKFNNDNSSSGMAGINTTPSTATAMGTTVTGSIGTTLLRSYTTFLSIPTLSLLGHLVNIHEEITQHLNQTFYNLTTISLHDWKMYAEMKSLAYEKYQIKLLSNFLPMGSLDQGLDVLQIMRNIHIFVNRFNYNMNIQQFVEYRSSGGQGNASKHINTIRIQSIAASIRQHGLGVLNTTVNYTYQFLIQKFHIFREFLHDDYIRAHLSREHRWYRKNRHNSDINNKYPYEHGMKFVKDIRKLGLNDGGKSYLDLFRMVITEIGNALGYVRMVRSASMYYCSEAVKYLPELDNDNMVSFEQCAGSQTFPGPQSSTSSTNDDTNMIRGANFHEETVRSGKNLDDVIKTLIKNFDAGSDYFKVLVNVFQTVLLSEENDDLKNFFIIVPALCISWTEASLQAKDNMFKATRGVTKEMYFTDDGFAIGIAYCLAITKQTRKFEALHWFDSVRAKLKADLHVLEQQQAARHAKEARIREAKEKAKKSFSFFGKKSEKPDEKAVDEDYEDMEEVHSLQTTAKRLEAQRRETEQLFFSLSGASIFFKRTDVET